MGIILNSVPFNTLSLLSEKEMDLYIESIVRMPNKVRAILFGSRAGAFTRGLVKGHGLPVEKSREAAFVILQVTTGKKTLAQLPSLLSTELKVANDKAQKMAKEIEQGLLEPVMSELKPFWRKERQPGAEKSIIKKRPGGDESLGLPNVLNLKEQKRPIKPPEI